MCYSCGSFGYQVPLSEGLSLLYYEQTVTCFNCEDELKISELKAHLKSCPKRKYRCPCSCSKLIELADLRLHIQECKKFAFVCSECELPVPVSDIGKEHKCVDALKAALKKCLDQLD